VTPSTDDKRPRLVAFGNVAVGFIAIGNVAVGVVAIGLTVAVGPVAIGLNAVGILLGLGLNAIGTLTLAAINGLGVVTFAGVNGLGAEVSSFVNTGASPFVALASMGVQIGVALFLREPPRPSPEVHPEVPLAEIVSGRRDRERVRVRITGGDEREVWLEEAGERHEGPTPKERVLVDARAVPSLRRARDEAEGRPIFVFLRGETEQIAGSNDADYRRAPATTRVLVAEDFEPVPLPPPFWARPGVVRRANRRSLWLGALVSAVVFALQFITG
jgi:hypothetical protein